MARKDFENMYIGSSGLFTTILREYERLRLCMSTNHKI
jgi:hypothetical protein